MALPERLRRSRGLRQLGLRTGLVPPRNTYSPAEAGMLHRLAAGRTRAVEIGVREGAASLVLVAALPQGADLHLVDPWGDGSQSQVGRAAKRRGGPRLHWHLAESRTVASEWSAAVDLVLIDGDHERSACRADWDLWAPHVRAGGIVAFHRARGGDPGPTAVVTELFGAGDPPGWRVVAERDTIVAAERLADA
ncbi:MAG: class I SAM-dependent methyltransferase [Thermoleophilaceae bacterium]|nr:class I SAM-dependent methyltransferase [Thermoleophilaceae bacterium]